MIHEKTVKVSMSSVVLSSFLLAMYPIEACDLDLCQCPQSCFLHFYWYLRTCILLSLCVNALSRAFFISTEEIMTKTMNSATVSMPSVVLSSFLHKTTIDVVGGTIMCQCPQSCFLHFYLSATSQPKTSFMCQCPQSCFLHFYLPHLIIANPFLGGVNALSRAFFISTEKVNSLIMMKKSVNALSRAFFISTTARAIANSDTIVCQCPQSCFLHFYKSTLTGVDNSSKMCQCPQSCFLHFYACNCAFYRNTLIVSMPSVVLSSFLRYPSKNPVKSRLSSLIFAGN